MSLNKTPRSSRLHVGIFGRTNVGKSTFLNMVAGQDVSITSKQPGTTTDVVEKQMELQPLGPLVFFDTGGLDDDSTLAGERIAKARHTLAGVDVAVLVLEPNSWGDFEEELLEEFEQHEVPYLLVVNKIDHESPEPDFQQKLEKKSEQEVIYVSSLAERGETDYVDQFKRQLIEICPEDFLDPPTLIGDLIFPGGLILLVVPIDLEAPKGRLILPQVQTIRNALDNEAAVLTVKDNGYKEILERIGVSPELVVCDSQSVELVGNQTPVDIPFTTFSILFARRKGNLRELIAGAQQLEKLQPGANVLIAEACSHHPIEGDIGREKIPAWLNEFVGAKLNYDVYSGRDFPRELKKYDIIIHCGGCMINRRRMLYRLQRARESGTPITNYGLCIARLHDLLGRALEPFEKGVNY